LTAYAELVNIIYITYPINLFAIIHLSHIFADDNDLMQARAKDTGKTFPFE